MQRPFLTTNSQSAVLHFLLYFLAALLGIAHGQSFAPLNAWWLELLCLGALFFLTHYTHSARQSALVGFSFGLTWFSSGIWWIFISLHQYGQMPAILAAVAVLLLCAFLALFPAMALWLTYTLYHSRQSSHFFTPTTQRPLPHILIAASVWGLSEWIRGTLLTGFPWLAVGYAHSDGPLAGYAAFFGVYGISTLAAAIAITISYLPLPAALSHKQRLRFAGMIGIIFVLGYLAPQYRFTQALEQSLTVRLIQSNIPQNLKFDPQIFEQNLKQQTQLITAKPADLIVTPETAIPLRLSDFPPPLISSLSLFSQQNNSQILLGAIGENQQGGLSNSLITLDGYRYDKRHLVPFGEFIPKGFRWFVNLMQIPLGDFSRGVKHQSPLMIKGTALAPNICYEDLFGEEIAANLRAHPAHILLNSTNIAWFGNTHAVDQHLQIARLRSLETQLPTLRATNTGATAWIDDYGQVREQLPRLHAGSLAINIRGREGLTPFVRWGNIPLFIFCGSVLLLAALLRLRKK